jgi:hypothetical protein
MHLCREEQTVLLGIVLINVESFPYGQIRLQSFQGCLCICKHHFEAGIDIAQILNGAIHEPLTIAGHLLETDLQAEAVLEVRSHIRVKPDLACSVRLFQQLKRV